MPLNVIWVWGSALSVFGLGNTATAGWASAAGAAASSADAATSATTTPRVTPDHRRDLNLSRNLLQPIMKPVTTANVAPRRRSLRVRTDTVSRPTARTDRSHVSFRRDAIRLRAARRRPARRR